MSRERPHVELYTDGACSGNPGPGGWAYILKLKDPPRESVVERSGGERLTTNNRMELKSVIEGLRALDRPCCVDLYSDSQYVINGLKEWLDQWKAKGWRRPRNAPVKNLELWKQLDELRHTHDVKYHWIRGHDDHPENERADHLAVAALQRITR